jgi:hypothetical protein
LLQRRNFLAGIMSAIHMRLNVLGPAILLAVGIAACCAQEPAPSVDGATTGTPARSGPNTDVGTTPEARQIMQRAVASDIVSWQAAKDYTFLQRVQTDDLDSNGRTKSTTVETHEILMLYGEPFERMVAKDDKPLPEKEQKKQDEKFEKETSKRANESSEERQKRLQKFEKERAEGRAFVREIVEAYDFTLAGSEKVSGRETWVIDGTPRPGFEGKRRASKLLPKIKPRFWIDQHDYSWVKLRAEATGTLSFGWIVARLHKGSAFEMQQARVNDEIWLPQRFDVKLDGRIALLKGINQNVHVTFTDYRRFRTETKISIAEPDTAPR